MKRRSLLEMIAKVLISVVTLSFLSSVYFLKKGAPSRVVSEAEKPAFIANSADLKEGTALKLEIRSEPGILIFYRGSLHAFSAICTHMGCPVSGRLLASKGILECPCHGSVFDPLTGERISGPAPRSLRRLKIEIKDGKVYV